MIKNTILTLFRMLILRLHNSPKSYALFPDTPNTHPPDSVTAISTSHFEELNYLLTVAFESQNKAFTGINNKQIKSHC